MLVKAPSYLQRTNLQANGNYINRWFDACSVMIRKLVENLIIDVYEKHGKQAEIQKDGEYLMLSGLIAAVHDCEAVGARHHWYDIDNERSGCYHCRVIREGRLRGGNQQLTEASHLQMASPTSKSAVGAEVGGLLVAA